MLGMREEPGHAGAVYLREEDRIYINCECAWVYTGDVASAIAAFNLHLPQIYNVDVEGAGRVSGERADDERP